MAAAVAVGTMSPMAASAATITDDPTTKKSITSTVPTVAAHRAAETAVLILGGNLITTDGVKDVMLDTFGSAYNINPNQYLYNYRVSGYSKSYGADGLIYQLTETVSPTVADLYGGSLKTGAAIYLGNAANSDGATYDSSVNSLAYECSTIEDMENTMVNLAAAIDAKGTGLYGTASTIATKYVNYIEKTVSYVKANRGTVKTVAIVAKSGDSYILYTSDYKKGTSINRAAEYLEDVTTNVVDTATSGALTDNGDGSYTVVDTSIIANANAVVTVGFQGAGTITEDTLADDKITLTGTLFNTLPDSSYGIYMNSAENALGMVALIMAIYEGSGSIKVDCEDAVAYYYSNFYHIETEYIDDLANVHFDECINYTGIDEDEIASDIAAYAAIVE